MTEDMPAGTKREGLEKEGLGAHQGSPGVGCMQPQPHGTSLGPGLSPHLYPGCNVTFAALPESDVHPASWGAVRPRGAGQVRSRPRAGLHTGTPDPRQRDGGTTGV